MKLNSNIKLFLFFFSYCMENGLLELHETDLLQALLNCQKESLEECSISPILKFKEEKVEEQIAEMFLEFEKIGYVKKEENGYQICMDEHQQQMIFKDLNKPNYKKEQQFIQTLYHYYLHPKKIVKEQDTSSNIYSVQDFFLTFASLLESHEIHVFDNDVFFHAFGVTFTENQIYSYLSILFGRKLSYDSKMFYDFCSLGFIKRIPMANFSFELTIPEKIKEQCLSSCTSYDMQMFEQMVNKYIEVKNQNIYR